MGVLQLLLLFRSAVAAPPPAVPLEVDLHTALHVTAPNFLGVNIDTASLYQGTLPHRLQFEDKGLASLAAGFAAAGGNGTTLRVGGSAAEDAVFGEATFGGVRPTQAVTAAPTCLLSLLTKRCTRSRREPSVGTCHPRFTTGCCCALCLPVLTPTSLGSRPQNRIVVDPAYWDQLVDFAGTAGHHSRHCQSAGTLPAFRSKHRPKMGAQKDSVGIG